jgi:hypothetical protein
MQGTDQSAGRKRKPFYRAAQSSGNSFIPAFLVGPEAGYITGAMLTIDGGLSL